MEYRRQNGLQVRILTIRVHRQQETRHRIDEPAHVEAAVGRTIKSDT